MVLHRGPTHIGVPSFGQVHGPCHVEGHNACPIRGPWQTSSFGVVKFGDYWSNVDKDVRSVKVVDIDI